MTLNVRPPPSFPKLILGNPSKIHSSKKDPDNKTRHLSGMFPREKHCPIFRSIRHHPAFVYDTLISDYSNLNVVSK